MKFSPVKNSLIAGERERVKINLSWLKKVGSPFNS
jgi:hypothetical protein